MGDGERVDFVGKRVTPCAVRRRWSCGSGTGARLSAKSVACVTRSPRQCSPAQLHRIEIKRVDVEAIVNISYESSDRDASHAGLPFGLLTRYSTDCRGLEATGEGSRDHLDGSV